MSESQAKVSRSCGWPDAAPQRDRAADEGADAEDKRKCNVSLPVVDSNAYWGDSTARSLCANLAIMDAAVAEGATATSDGQVPPQNQI